MGKTNSTTICTRKIQQRKIFYELFPPALKPKINPVPVDISELQRPSALKTIMIEASKDQHQKDILNLMDSMLNQIDILLAKDDCEKCLSTFFILTENYPVYQNCYIIPEDLNNYYKKYIVLPRDSIVKLNYDALQQSECDKWFEARRQRISASINVHNIKSRKTKKIESLVAEMLRPKNINNSAVKYGRKYESVARKEYESIYNVTVKQVGVTISDKQPWLCASLDGVVIKDSSIVKIVEIKCPQSCEKRPIVDEKLKVSNVSYLEFIDGKTELKKSVPYYTQCQVQMYVCGLKSCDLYVYSPVKSCCVSVFRNENFLQEVILKSESFYFQFYLPALYKASNQETKAATLLMREKQFQMRPFTGRNIINII